MVGIGYFAQKTPLKFLHIDHKEIREYRLTNGKKCDKIALQVDAKINFRKVVKI